MKSMLKKSQKKVNQREIDFPEDMRKVKEKKELVLNIKKNWKNFRQPVELVEWKIWNITT